MALVGPSTVHSQTQAEFNALAHATVRILEPRLRLLNEGGSTVRLLSDSPWANGVRSLLERRFSQEEELGGEAEGGATTVFLIAPYFRDNRAVVEVGFAQCISGGDRRKRVISVDAYVFEPVGSAWRLSDHSTIGTIEGECDGYTHRLRSSEIQQWIVEPNDLKLQRL